MNFTEQQKRAIFSRDKNLLVAAAAGSGKTAVLVERILQMLVEGNFRVDEMLIVTFTNAAAQEMRSRIFSAIEKKISAETDSEIIARLERQSVLLSGATITTFHAFCFSVIKRHFSKIDLDPRLREGNEHELKILKQEVIEELFEEKYSGDEEFLKFSDKFGGNVHGDDELYKIVLKLYEASCSRPYPSQWLDYLTKFYEQPKNFFVEGKIWLDLLLNFALDKVRETVEDCLLTCTNCLGESYRLEKISKKFEGVRNNFEKDFALLKNLKVACDDWDKLFKVVNSEIGFEVFSRKSVPDDLKTQKENLKNLRDDYKGQIQKLKDSVTKPKAEIILEIENLVAPVKKLVEITKDFEEKFSAAKRERGIIDFNDMEHLALKIFNTDKKVSDAYRAKFKIVMVDEYQDTSDVQEEIIGKIVSENNFFAVGDVKQSIYRFRNASPKNFLDKYKTYVNRDNCERIDLSKNFRSRLSVVNSVNEIFRKLMTEEAMEIDYNEDAELNFGAVEDYPPAENIFEEPTEFLIIDQNKNSDRDTSEEPEENFEELDKLEKEIQLIANKIRTMMKDGKQIWDREKKIYRSLTFKDIVILMRATDGKTNKILEVLAKNQIPAYAEDKGGYFKAQEVQTILNLLRVLENSRQDIPLASVMMSLIGGFSAEELADLRIDDRDSDLFTLVCNKSLEENNFGLKCADFLKKINYWRELARQVSVPELLSKIYRETGFYDYFDKNSDKVAQANLRVLIDRAAEYENTNFRGLSRFIQFIKKMRELNNDLSSARTLGENENVVRIMTIHKSKGLEFPVVFVADLGKKFNTKDLNENIVIHRNLGIGISRAVEGTSGINYIKTFAKSVIENKIREENLAEELRILYVAFTRAKEKLFLVGTVGNIKNLENFSEDKKISSQKLKSAKKPLDWLLMLKNSPSIKTEIFKSEEIKLSGEKILSEEKVSEKIEKLPPSPLENIPAKVSVTEVKRRLAEFDEEKTAANFIEQKKIYRRPSFIQKKSFSPAELGSLIHSVMQHLNLSESLDEKNISAQISEMVDKKIFDEIQGEKLKSKAKNISKFFSSSIGKEMLAAKKIYRELPFSYYTQAEKIGEGKIFKNAHGEKIFIQGIIDLLFQNSSGEWILLDYKTDRENSDEYFIKEYREQIRLYVQAAENILNLKISKKYLYLLNSDREIFLE